MQSIHKWLVKVKNIYYPVSCRIELFQYLVFFNIYIYLINVIHSIPVAQKDKLMNIWIRLRLHKVFGPILVDPILLLTYVFEQQWTPVPPEKTNAARERAHGEKLCPNFRWFISRCLDFLEYSNGNSCSDL